MRHIRFVNLQALKKRCCVRLPKVFSLLNITLLWGRRICGRSLLASSCLLYVSCMACNSRSQFCMLLRVCRIQRDGIFFSKALTVSVAWSWNVSNGNSMRYVDSGNHLDIRSFSNYWLEALAALHSHLQSLQSSFGVMVT